MKVETDFGVRVKTNYGVFLLWPQTSDLSSSLLVFTLTPFIADPIYCSRRTSFLNYGFKYDSIGAVFSIDLNGVTSWLRQSHG